MKTVLSRIYRVTLRELRSLLSNRTYWFMVSAPLLLGGALVVILTVAALLLSVVQVAKPDSDPLGSGRVLVWVVPGLTVSQEAEVDALLAGASALESKAEVISWIQRFRIYAHLLRTGRSEVAREMKEGPERKLQLERQVHSNLDEIKAQIPRPFDAGLVLRPGPDDRVAFEIVHEPGILASRIMERRLRAAIDAWNRHGSSQVPAANVREVVAEGVETWPVILALLLWTVGVAYSYYGVAVQSVASVLAGEREQRTLEVLLALPVAPREIVLGKLLALTAATLIPTSFWILSGCGAVSLFLGVEPPTLRLLWLATCVVAPLMAVACTVSATAPTTTLAKNRLGLVNLAVMVAIGGGTWLWQHLHPGGDNPLVGVVSVLSGGEGALDWGVGLSLLAVGTTLGLNEVAAHYLRPAP